MPDPIFEPRCLATTIGSLPHKDVNAGTRLMLESTPELPSWVQFPRLIFEENMMVQFTEGLPGLVREGERIFFDTSRPDFVDQLTDFYSRYLAVMEAGADAPDAGSSALESFALSPEYAAGFHALTAYLESAGAPPGMVAVKGQVTGPFTQATNTLDQNRRCAYYNDELHDVIVKMVALKALWQIDKLKPFASQTMIFLDEPSLLGYGSSTFITIGREDVIRDINEVVAAIHSRGGLAGVHCEANTDWSLLMDTRLDVLDFDAYDHLQAVTLYPAELTAFFERGGSLGWGIVPTLDREAAGSETLDTLEARFEAGLECFTQKGFARELLIRRALLTPSCGAGGVLDEPLAGRVLGLLRDLSLRLQTKYGMLSG